MKPQRSLGLHKSDGSSSIIGFNKTFQAFPNAAAAMRGKAIVTLEINLKTLYQGKLRELD